MASVYYSVMLRRKNLKQLQVGTELRARFVIPFDDATFPLSTAQTANSLEAQETRRVSSAEK